MRYITLGDTLYAVGLLWQTHKGPGGRKVLLRQARDVAKEFGAEKFNCVALRTLQFGIGQSPDLPLPRAYPLASSLRLQRQESFIGVFHLAESFWWVCGISRSLIAADGDAFCGSLEEAEATAKDLRSLFGDGEIAYFVTPEEATSYLLPLLKPEKRLEPLVFGTAGQKKLQVRIGMAAAAALTLFGAFWAYDAYQDHSATNRMRDLLQLKDRARAEMRAHPERHFSQGWLGVPSVMDAGTQCAEAMLAEPLVVQGWSLDEVLCAPGSSVTVSRLHNVGADYINLPPTMRIITPQSSRVSFPLPSLQKIPPFAHTELLPREQATALLYQITQLMHANLENLNWEQPEKIEEDGQVIFTAPWQKGKFIIGTLPHEYFASRKLFSILSFPGISVSGINFKHTSNLNLWKIQGVIYAQTEPSK